MTEEEFLNLSDEDFLEIWSIFQKESKYKTEKNTPTGFGDFLKDKYNLNLEDILSRFIPNGRNNKI